jgi:5'-3' exonuclease
MGVERFFSSIYKEFNIIKNINKPYPKYNCDHFLIDFNSIIHTITSIEKNLDYQNIFNQIEKYLNNLTDIVNCKNLYIAIDGVPTLAKMLEQKKRRYLAEIINNIIISKNVKIEDHFDKKLISAGTEFMTKLVEHLKQIKIKKKPLGFNINITISDFNEDGEGEMKIIKYIEKNNLDDVFVYSPDSDMILLLSMLSIKNLILFRHDQRQSKIINNNYEYVYNYLDVNRFKDILINYIKSKNIFDFDNQKIINDIIYIFTLFGNDFLPKMESLKVEMDLFILIDYYLITFSSDNQYILNYDNKVSLNSNKLLQLFEHLYAIEYLLIFRNLQDYLYKNYEVNFRNKFIYQLKNKFIRNYQEYHYQLIKYINWSKILSNPLDYLLINVNDLQKHLEDYIKINGFKNEIFLAENIYDLRFKLELKNRNQSINDKYHSEKIKDKQGLFFDEKKIRYQIDFKLDEYSKIFNTKDNFYNNLNLDKLLKEKFDGNYNSIYNNVYKINDYYKKKYIEGFIWIMEYYFNKTNSNLYGYFYHKSPLIKDLVNVISSKSIKNINLDYFKITPPELLLYITPFKNDINDIKNKLSLLGIYQDNLDIANKIKNNKNFIFINNNISIDCTGSIFTSKCHYLPLNQEINLISFINSIR